ncbi:hypothetical protein [Methanoculleus sp. 10]|jgi:hypothetical protein|uniref:hypothetical protein n=1 Tax=Methanoculleus sp. 10 TaxID=430615 RepID=UPI0025FCE5B3|nr:hypothetical protein [Methanoculleus sp. 10]
MGTEPGFTNPENVGELADVGVAEAPGGLPPVPVKAHCRGLEPRETGSPGCCGGSGCGSGPAND